MQRSGSYFNCPNHALISSLVSGAHWFLSCCHRTATIRSSPSRRVGGKARQKCIACTLCLERCLGVDNTVLWQVPSHVSSSVQSPPLQSCPEVLLATKTIRSRPQFKNRVTGLAFQQWRALLLGVFGPLTTHSGTWAKQAWSACQAHNRVQSAVELAARRESDLGCSVGRVVQKSYWNDLVLSSTKTICCVSWSWTDPVPFGSQCQRSLDPRPSSCSGALDHRWRDARRLLCPCRNVCQQ